MESLGYGREYMDEFDSLEEALMYSNEGVQEAYNNTSPEDSPTHPNDMPTVKQCEDTLPSRWDTDEDVFYEMPNEDTDRKIVLLSIYQGETVYVIRSGFEDEDNWD